MKRYLVLIFTCLALLVNAHDYPQNDFIAPVDYKMTLSGNFGELREDHFHSGIDIKTDGIIGKKIYAVADGYISRIKVSATGFGKAIYIRHKNGYTTVYGHLNRFSKDVANWVRTQQYQRESFEVDLYPRVDQFMVRQGEIIAFSGDSGGSAGPHLHFEIRETHTEKPVNPLLFGFDIKDFIKPKITGLKVYPLSESSEVNGNYNEWEFKTEGWGLVHRLKRDKPIVVSGEIGFAVKTHDLLNDSYNKNGVYSIELLIDSTLIYFHKIESFSFSESRYVNSLIDYAHYIDQKQRYQRSLVDEGNQLSIIQSVYKQGKVLFNDSLLHTLIYEIKDVYGNTSRLTCKLQSKSFVLQENDEDENKGETWFKYDSENNFERDDIKIHFKVRSFYHSFKFEYSKENADSIYYSDIHHIHFKQFPVHKQYKLKLKAKNLSSELSSKALIVDLNSDEPNPQGGVFKDGYIKAFTRRLGTFAVMIDTIPPEIAALNIHQHKKIPGYKTISFKIKDDLSGIKSYRGTVNKEWALFEYDPKNDRLTYYVDELMIKGKNEISLEVVDDRDNISTYTAEVFY